MTELRVDAHHHVWDTTHRPQPWTDELPELTGRWELDLLRPLLSDSGFDRTVLVQTICVPEETPELLALADSAPEVGAVVGWTDLTSPGVAEELVRLTSLPGGRFLAGIRHQVQEEPDPRWLDRPDVRRGLAAVAAAGLVYDLVVVPAQLPAVVDVVRALPGLMFVLDHAGKPDIAGHGLADWRTAMLELAGLPNISVKLSGLTMLATADWRTDDLRPCATLLLDEFGPDRMMFGSDWPVCTLAGSYRRTVRTAEELTAALTGPERAAVFGGTATRIYGVS